MGIGVRLASALRILRSDGLGTLLRLLSRGDMVRVKGWVVPRRYARFFLSYYERGVKEYVTGFKPDTFVVAGAWPGEYLVLAWRLGASRVIGFEADPGNYVECVKLILRNHDKWDYVRLGPDYVHARSGSRYLVVYNRALWDREAWLNLGNCGAMGDPGTRCVRGRGSTVWAARLARVIGWAEREHLGRCLVLLDIEGSEVKALEGARGIWNKCAFIIEVWDANRAGYKRYAEENGFKVQVLHRAPNGTEYWLLQRG